VRYNLLPWLGGILTVPLVMAFSSTSGISVPSAASSSHILGLAAQYPPWMYD
jgi:hypothetical protein